MRSTICLTMIVKNESNVITRTLERVAPLIDYWVICDTGSTDNTCETIEAFFADKKIPGKIYHDAWKDFAHNRTLAFRRSRSCADYSWVLDADDILRGTLTFPSPMTKDAYSLHYGGVDALQFRRPQIFNNRWEWVYIGVVHEQVVRADGQPLEYDHIEGDYHLDYMDSRIHLTNHRAKNPLKYLRDAQTMERQLEKEKNKFMYWRYVFYIAQSYFDYGDFEKAFEYYKKHLENTKNEETYFAHLYAALCLEKIDKNVHKEAMIEYLFKGHLLQPKLAECLFQIALIHANDFEFEKAYSTLLLCKDCKIANITHYSRLNEMLYILDIPYLYMYTCHRLGKTTEEEATWRSLLGDCPRQILEKTDVRHYPLAMTVLSSWKTTLSKDPFEFTLGMSSTTTSEDVYTIPSLYRRVSDPHLLSRQDTNRFQLRGASDGWLFVQSWSIATVISTMLEKGITKMNLCHSETFSTPRQEGDATLFIQDTATEETVESDWETSLCIRYPLASYELVHENRSSESTTVTMCFQGTKEDFLSTFFVFCLCQEFGFRFRWCKRPWKGAVSFSGVWEKKEDLKNYFLSYPTLVAGNFFRVEWLPHDYKTVAWPAFQRFVSCSQEKFDVQDDAVDWLPMVGAERFIVHSVHFPLRPVLAHLVVLVDAVWEWAPGMDPSTLLDLKEVSSDLKLSLWNRPVPLALTTKGNEILHYTPCVSVDPKYTCDSLSLCIEDDFILTEPFTSWQIHFMDLVWNIRQWKHPWKQVQLCVGNPPEGPFYLKNRLHPESTEYYYHPLFENVTEESMAPTRSLFFPRLHFLDAEVYYTTTSEMSVLPSRFDASNELGFYKIWRSPVFDLEKDNDYPGDSVAARYFHAEPLSEPLPLSKASTRVPSIPKKTMPVYAVSRDKKRAATAVQHAKKGCLTVVPMVASTLTTVQAHIEFWQSLSEDPVHDYYIIVEDKVQWQTQSPLIEDLEGNLSMVLNTLDKCPMWDIVLLGGTKKKQEDEQGRLSLWRQYGDEEVEGEHYGGYMIHKKAAHFLLRVVEQCGVADHSVESLFHFYSQRFLQMHRVTPYLVAP